MGDTLSCLGAVGNVTDHVLAERSATAVLRVFDEFWIDAKDGIAWAGGGEMERARALAKFSSVQSAMVLDFPGDGGDEQTSDTGQHDQPATSS